MRKNLLKKVDHRESIYTGFAVQHTRIFLINKSQNT